MRNLWLPSYLAVLAIVFIWALTQYRRAKEPIFISQTVPTGYTKATSLEQKSWQEQADLVWDNGEKEKSKVTAVVNPISAPNISTHNASTFKQKEEKNLLSTKTPLPEKTFQQQDSIATSILAFRPPTTKTRTQIKNTKPAKKHSSSLALTNAKVKKKGKHFHTNQFQGHNKKKSKYSHHSLVKNWHVAGK